MYAPYLSREFIALLQDITIIADVVSFMCLLTRRTASKDSIGDIIASPIGVSDELLGDPA